MSKYMHMTSYKYFKNIVKLNDRKLLKLKSKSLIHEKQRTCFFNICNLSRATLLWLLIGQIYRKLSEFF